MRLRQTKVPCPSCGNPKVYYSRQCSKCSSRDRAIARNTTHGMTGTPECDAWNSMKARCSDPNHKFWEHYGGRGIKVCCEWLGEHGFENFLAHIGPRTSPKHSLDRWPNQNGNYEPGNVRWATQKEQCRNLRNNRFATHEGKTQCIGAWAEELGLTIPFLWGRVVRQGMTIEQAIKTPRRYKTR